MAKPRGMEMPTFFAIDIGGTKVELAIGNQDGALLKTARVPTAEWNDGEAAARGMVERLKDLADGLSQDQRPVAIGVGSPGPLDIRRGRLLTPSNLPSWAHLPIVDRLTAGLGIPAYLENDATAAGLAEWRYGAGRETRHMIYLTVSTGVGAGIIAEGRVLRGAGDNAGEVGHIVVVPDGIPCHCGNRGCLETVASGSAIGRQGEEHRRESSLLNGCQGPVGAKEVFQAAAQGDPVAQSIINEAARWLAWAIGTLVNVFNPECVVIGGGVAENQEALLGPIRAAIGPYVMPDLWAAMRMVISPLGKDVGVKGALAVAQARWTETP